MAKGEWWDDKNLKSAKLGLPCWLIFNVFRYQSWLTHLVSVLDTWTGSVNHSWSANRHVDDVSPPRISLAPIILFDWPKILFSQSCDQWLKMWSMVIILKSNLICIATVIAHHYNYIQSNECAPMLPQSTGLP